MLTQHTDEHWSIKYTCGELGPSSGQVNLQSRGPAGHPVEVIVTAVTLGPIAVKASEPARGRMVNRVVEFVPRSA